MALENVGIGGVLTFDGASAVIGMLRAQGAATRLSQSQSILSQATARVGMAMRTAGMGMVKLGLVTAPLTAALLYAGNYAAKFEKQMNAVKAVAQGSVEDMKALTLAAKQFGATTVFDPVEVAKAEQELAVAGYNAVDTLKALPGVLSAAAAEGMPLAKSVEIVTGVLRGMGLEADQSARVADVLALASARTSATIQSLGMGMSYTAARAKVMGIDLETTVAMVGLLSDAGLKGARAGTSFNAMLEKLSRPNKAATAYLKAHNIEMKHTKTGAFDVISAVKDIAKAVNAEGDALKRSAILHDVFGERGARAFGALMSGVDTGKIDTLVSELRKAEGAAEKMANTRLEGFVGGLTKLANAAKAFGLELMGGIVGDSGIELNKMAKSVGNVVSALQELGSSVSANRHELEGKYGPTAVAIAYGIADAIKTIRGAVETVRIALFTFIKKLTGEASPDVIQTVTKWITILLVSAAAVGPILIALGGLVAFIGGTVLPALEGIAIAIGVITGTGLVMTAAFGLVYVALEKNKYGAESFGSVTERVFNMAVEGAKRVTAALDEVKVKVEEEVAGCFDRMKSRVAKFSIESGMHVKQMTGAMSLSMKELQPIWRAQFEAMKSVLGFFAKITVKTFGIIAQALRPVIEAIKELAILILEGVVNGLRAALAPIFKLVDALGGAEGKFWAEIGFFVSQKNFRLRTGEGRLASLDEAENLGRIDEEMKAVNTDEALLAQAAKITNDIAGIKAQNEKPEVNVNVALKDERKLEVHNCVNLDGKEIAVATGRHKQEIGERAGWRTTPWHGRQMLETGAAPGGLGGGL